MSKKKSLGSSPIGYSTAGVNSFGFIRDLGVSGKETAFAKKPVSVNANQSYVSRVNSADRGGGAEKKITSYYLEVDLISRLKRMADHKETYYSSLVSEAIRYWVEIHGY